MNPAPLQCQKCFQPVPCAKDKMQVEQGKVSRILAVDVGVRLAVPPRVTCGSDPILKDPSVGLGLSHNDGPYTVF